MYNIFKYDFLNFLEENYEKIVNSCEKNEKNSKKLNKTQYKISEDLGKNTNNDKKREICVLPPILKKNGLKSALIFPIIKNPYLNDGFIRRPIGLFYVTIWGKISAYNLDEFDFCNKKDFSKKYYNIEDLNLNFLNVDNVLDFQNSKKSISTIKTENTININTTNLISKNGLLRNSYDKNEVSFGDDKEAYENSLYNGNKNLENMNLKDHDNNFGMNLKIKKYWPNKSFDNEEYIRICLEFLYKTYLKNKNILSKNSKYCRKYLSMLGKMFPKDFFNFYIELQNNKIEKLEDNEIERRKNNILHEKKLQKEAQISEEKNKKIALEKIHCELSNFTRKEIMPAYKGIGTYSKLMFFEKVGKFLKEFDEKFLKDEYTKFVNIETQNRNYEKNVNKSKIRLIKIFSESIDNEERKDIQIDTLSKILIVFLNALLIEERKKSIIPNFEEEIEESKQLFEENINNVKNLNAKNILKAYYECLNKDYLEEDKNNFSQLFKGYLFIFSYLN